MIILTKHIYFSLNYIMSVNTYLKKLKHIKIQSVFKRVLTVLLVLIAIAVLIGFVFLITRMSGKSALSGKHADAVPDMPAHVNVIASEDSQPESDSSIQADIPEKGTVRYNGKTYRYNSDIITLLLLGIDKDGEPDSSYQPGSGGHADTVILAVFDTKQEKLSFISVSRETMTEIAVYGVLGELIGYKTAQLALSYAYGDSPQKSCDLTLTAVSKLFYSLPVHGYFTINQSAIEPANDLIGGVKLTLLDDFSARDPSMVKGAEITLNGRQAEMYLRGRMSLSDDTNAARMTRQRQYMSAFINTALSKMKSEPTLPLTVYNAVEPYTVTDLSVNEITYAVSEAVRYGFSEDSLYTVKGTQTEGSEFSEFHVDETALYELILNLFYDVIL